MADMILKVTPDELTKKSGEFKTHRSTMIRIMEEAKNNVTNLRGAWVGAAADEFQAKFKEMYTSCDMILSEMQKHENVLKEAAQVYTTSENAAKLQIEKLPTKGVFK